MGEQSKSVVAALYALADRQPDSVFLEISGEQETPATLVNRTACLASGLAGLGVTRSTAVATILPNEMSAAVTWLAANSLGAFDVPLNTGLRGRMLVDPLNASRAEILIVSSEAFERILEVRDELSFVRDVVVCDGPIPDRSTWNCFSLGELESSEGTISPVAGEPSDLSTLLFTGGTTGTSKGCMISNGYVISFMSQMMCFMSLGEGDVVWTPLPLCHINARGTLAGAIMTGKRTVIERRFSVSDFWPAIARAKATHARIIAGMFRLIAMSPSGPLEGPSLRYALGSGVGVDVGEIWYKRWHVIARSPGFGMTEASMIVDNGSIDVAPPPGSVGRQNAVFEVAISDGDDGVAPPGKEGEILVRPRRPWSMFSGYWGLPELTVQRTANLWFHSRDVGRMDEDGWLYFTGRLDEFVRVLGENVPCREVEEAIGQHADVREAAAYAVSDPSMYGEESLMLAVTLLDGSVASESDLFEFLRERLPEFAVPRYLEIRAEFPRGAVGRIAKHVLHEEGVTASTRMRPPKRSADSK